MTIMLRDGFQRTSTRPSCHSHSFQPNTAGHFREDYPNKEPEFGAFNFSLKQAADGQMQISRVPIPEMPEELKTVIEEMG